MSPPSVHQFARRVGVNLHVPGAAVVADPADGFTFFHPRQLDNGAILAQGLPDALVALLVGQVHAARIRRDADVVGDKNQHRIRVGVLAVGLDGSQFLFVRSSSKQVLDAADEEHLKRRHQRRSTRAIENLWQVGFGQIKLKQAEVAEFGRHQVLENGFAAALAEENLIAHEDIHRTQLASLHFGNEAISLGEGPH